MDIDSELWRERLEINLHDLHTDVARQPAYYAEIAELGAELKANVQQAKLSRDLVKAKVDTQIRSSPATFGLEKVTEGAIQSVLTDSSKMVKAERALLVCQKEHDLVQVLVTAFEHRRSMLNNEVQLYMANYWDERNAMSTVPKEGRERLRKDRTEEIVERRRRKAEGRGE